MRTTTRCCLTPHEPAPDQHKVSGAYRHLEPSYFLAQQPYATPVMARHASSGGSRLGVDIQWFSTADLDSNPGTQDCLLGLGTKPKQLKISYSS